MTNSSDRPFALRFSYFKERAGDPVTKTVRRWQGREKDPCPETVLIGGIECFRDETEAMEWLQRNMKPRHPEPKELAEGRKLGIKWQKQRKAARLARESADAQTA